MDPGSKPRRLVAAVAIALWWGAPAAADELLIDGIAAQVGSDIVLISEVEELVGPMVVRMRQAGAPPLEIAKARAEGLEQLIEWRLIEQVAKRAELYATDEEIDQTVEAIAQENGLTVDELKDNIAGHGLSFDDYRAQIKRQVERRKVVGAMVGSQVRVEEDVVKRLYDERFAEQRTEGTEVHLRQIFVPFESEDPAVRAEICARVAGARERVQAGEPFQSVANQVSYVQPDRGGDIGWLHLDELAPWMEPVVAKLEPGGTSDLIELPFGCSLLELVERREVTPISFEQAKAALENEVYQRKLGQEYTVWMEKLRETTYIERKGHFAEAAQLDGATALPVPARDPLRP